VSGGIPPKKAAANPFSTLSGLGSLPEG